jgi:hypothetical protein
MKLSRINSAFFNELIQNLEIPDSAYERAKARYNDIGNWMGRGESKCKDFSPHIFPQGSFRLGTVVRPINSADDFDLDLSCEFKSKISKDTITQSELKELIRVELELYRISKGINKKLKPKHRCWRLEYSDQFNFHIDIVPCIPENENINEGFNKSFRINSNTEILQVPYSELTVALTDDRHEQYDQICKNWEVSNPIGYAKWFETRMRLAEQLLMERAKFLKSVQIDDIPEYKWKSPLQTAVQFLKRHRDMMFNEDSDTKPISIIITTLAGCAYCGETDVVEAITNILAKMHEYVRHNNPRIPNPVNPDEDFAERWSTAEGKSLNLEQNFWYWLEQARVDFSTLKSDENFIVLEEKLKTKFNISVDANKLRKSLGMLSVSPSIITSKEHTIIEPARPWKSGV